MESAEVAVKRRVRLDALIACLERSTVARKLGMEQVRALVASVAAELGAGDELQLDPVWQVLRKQPGVDIEDAAAPLLVIKAYERELGMNVSLPMALAALSQKEEARLRDGLGLSRAEFAGVVAALAEEARAQAAPAPAATVAPTPSRAHKVAPAKPSRRAPPIAQLLAIVLVIAAAAGGAAWLQLKDPATGMDLGESEAIVHLEEGKRTGSSMTARLADPKWDALAKPERRALADKLFDTWAKHGVEALVVVDGGGGVRINASTLGGVRVVAVYP